MHLAIECDNYQKVWYKLHISHDSAKWPNILKLCELLFSIALSNAYVERIFSLLKKYKSREKDLS